MSLSSQRKIWLRLVTLSLIAAMGLVIVGSSRAQGPADRAASADSDTGVTVITPGPTVSPTELALAMDIPPANLVSASIGTSDPAGTGVEDAPLGAFFPIVGDTYTILSTGLAVSADDPDDNNDEIFMGGGFDDDVSGILGGLDNSEGRDLVQLEIVLTPPAGSTALSFDFSFYSEEFPDFVNSQFNDSFLAELGAEPFSSGLTIVDDNASSPDNFALDPNGDVISVNAAFGFDPADPNPNTGTTYDGSSGLLTAIGCVPEGLPAGSNIVLILSITDLGDDRLDSAVFLDNFRWGDQPNCTSGVDDEDPTAITLVDFTVEPNEGQALIQWVTGTEIDNAGFNLYRATSPEGPWVKANSALIGAQGDPVSGAAYTFVDQPGRGTFYYRLEDIDFYGVNTLHAPVIAELGPAVRVPWFRPRMPAF